MVTKLKGVYKLSVYCDETVPPFGPTLPNPPEFQVSGARYDGSYTCCELWMNQIMQNDEVKTKTNETNEQKRKKRNERWLFLWTFFLLLLKSRLLCTSLRIHSLFTQTSGYSVCVCLCVEEKGELERWIERNTWKNYHFHLRMRRHSVNFCSWNWSMAKKRHSKRRHSPANVNVRWICW